MLLHFCQCAHELTVSATVTVSVCHARAHPGVTGLLFDYVGTAVEKGDLFKLFMANDRVPLKVGVGCPSLWWFC